MVTETRIKIVTAVDGTQTFYPQHKGLVIWHHFVKYIHWDWTIDVSCKTIEEAQGGHR